MLGMPVVSVRMWVSYQYCFGSLPLWVTMELWLRQGLPHPPNKWLLAWALQRVWGETVEIARDS